MQTFHRHPLLFVLGTRPEAIKLLPVIRAFQAEACFNARVCVTGQHRELVDHVLTSFGVRPDFDLDVMLPGQSLAAMTAKIIAACESVMERLKPELVFVQGDTTSAFAAAVAASQCGFPVAHVEAGLRTHRKSSPFPEELNRTIIGHIARLHFAPGRRAVGNLRREGITQGMHVVGNTIVDALQAALKTTPWSHLSFGEGAPAGGSTQKKLVVTLHRRESFGEPLVNVCVALRKIVETYTRSEIFFPVHPNPVVQQTVRSHLGGIRNIHLLAPLSYLEFVRLLSNASLIISDSGGVLEEAETLGLPVLVAREVTERIEAISAGNALLVGTDADAIFAAAAKFLDASFAPARRDRPLRRTFGDGRATARILRITREHLSKGVASNSFQSAPLPTAA